ncbi:unknown [Prevotella sp. CAG:592]|nr:unknown [Prevotella sp. CAG:592]
MGKWENGKMGKWEKCYKDFSNGHTFSDKQTTANFTPLFLKILQIQQHEAWQT